MEVREEERTEAVEEQNIILAFCIDKVVSARRFCSPAMLSENDWRGREKFTAHAE